MGHEASGVVAKINSSVTNVKEGDRVTFDSMVSCGKCYFCRSDQQNLCRSARPSTFPAASTDNTDVLQNIQWCRNILQYRTTCL